MPQEIPFSDIPSGVLNNIPSTDADPVNLVSYELTREQVEEVASSLSDRERRVIMSRFGLVDGRSHTLVEVGREIGRSESTVRRVEKRALAKLSRPSSSRYLRNYLSK